MVEEDKEKDAIQKEYKQALFKVKDMELGDMVGAAYPKNDKFEYYYYEGKRIKIIMFQYKFN